MPYSCYDNGVLAMSEPQKVIVTDIKMSFGSMVIFMVKWVLASIPAFLILALIFAVLIGVFGGMFGAQLK
jgi:hypothetical protein